MSADPGCSPYTPHKLEHFRSLIRVHLEMVAGARRKFHAAWPRYLYFDLNAGRGRQVCGGELLCGSPLIFMQEAERAGIVYDAFLFEQDPDALASLGEALTEVRPNPGSQVHVIPGDHMETVPHLIRHLLPTVQGRFFGLVIADPFGCFHAEAMLPVLEARPGDNLIDGVVSFATTAHKRQANATRPLDELAKLPRRRRMIREPIPLADGGWNWTIAYVTNGPVPEWKSERFHDLRTEKGQEVAWRLNTTKVERSSPKAVCRIAATASTSGIPGFGQPVLQRSREPGASASAAATLQLRFTTFDTRSGGRST